LHSLRIWGAINFRSQSSHDGHFFLREIFRHEKLDLIPAIHADQRQSNARIPRRGLDNGSSRRKPAFLFGAPNDPDGGTVFDASARIKIFKFGENVGRSASNEPFEPQHGRSTDQVGYIVGDPEMSSFESFLMHVTGS
jgi:hypothetical protein